MITYYFRTIKDESLKTVAEFRTGVWIHVTSPTEAELIDLFGSLQLDDTFIEDVQDFFEVPRYERVDGAGYFFTRYPFHAEQEATDTAPLLIIVGESFVLTIAQRDVPPFQRFIDGREAIVTTQKTKLFMQMMQAITNSFERQLVSLRKAVHRDRAKLRRIGNKEIVRFVGYEHKLNDFVAAALPTNTALRQVAKGNGMQLYDDDREFMEDLMIDNSQLVDSARSVLNTIQNVRNATEAILTNNLNATIKALTVLTILLTIPTIAASLYGMNVPLPLAEHPYAFWLVLVTIGMVVSLVVWYFKRQGWL